VKILVVDDDETLVKGLIRAFTAIGYEVNACYDGGLAMSSIDSVQPDVLILDVMLPGKDGLTILREVREKYPDLPVIMLTARAEDVDKVVGLEMGADDYLSKPFSLRELEARVKAVMRRAGSSKPGARSQLRVGDLLIDLSLHRVWKGKMELVLTPREFQVLGTLLRNRGMVFTREKLLELCWGYDYLGGSRAVDILISRLREKVEDNPEKPRYILTRRGVGYYCE